MVVVVVIVMVIVMVVVVMVIAAILVAPLVAVAMPARVARGVELFAIVPGLVALGPVTVDVMIQAVLPFVDVPVAGAHIVIRTRGLRAAHEQQSAGKSGGKSRVL